MAKNHFTSSSNQGHSPTTGPMRGRDRGSHSNVDRDRSFRDDRDSPYGPDESENGDNLSFYGNASSPDRGFSGSRNVGNSPRGARSNYQNDSQDGFRNDALSGSSNASNSSNYDRSARDSDRDYRYDSMNEENRWSDRNFNRQSMSNDPYSSRSAPDVLQRTDRGESGRSMSNNSYGSVGYGSAQDAGRYPGAGYTSSPNVGTSMGNDYGYRASNVQSQTAYGSSSGSNSMNEGRHYGKGPKGYKRSDDRIKEEVSDRLWHHAHIDASDVSIEVKDGAVTLSGTVEDRSMKRLIESEIENLSGVEDVHNQIKVKKADSSASTSKSKSASTTTSSTGNTGTKGSDLM